MIKKVLFATVAVALAVCLMACGKAGDETTAADTTELDTSITEPTVTEGTETDPIAPEGEHVHSYSETLTAPTCTSIGRKTMQCACGDIQKIIEYLPMTAHTANEASCGVDAVCSVCGKVVVEKYDHVIKYITVTPLTCTVDGVEKALCERCGYTDEIVTKASHSLGELVLTAGKVSSKCSKCGETVADILYTNYHDEGSSGVTYSGGKFTLDSTVKYNIPQQLIGVKAPYQVGFTFTLTGIVNSNNLVNNNNGRNIFQYLYSNKYNSLVRIFPASDGKGGYLTDVVEMGTLDEINVSSTKFIKMKVGESVKVSICVDPADNSADIYFNGEFMMTREGDTDGFIPGSSQFSFGYGKSDAFTGTVSDISIIQVKSE